MEEMVHSLCGVADGRGGQRLVEVPRDIQRFDSKRKRQFIRIQPKKWMVFREIQPSVIVV